MRRCGGAEAEVSGARHAATARCVAKSQASCEGAGCAAPIGRGAKRENACRELGRSAERKSSRCESGDARSARARVANLAMRGARDRTRLIASAGVGRQRANASWRQCEPIRGPGGGEVRKPPTRSRFVSPPAVGAKQRGYLRSGSPSLFAAILKTKTRPMRPRLIKWREKDSNLRRRTPADLQSAPFGHLGIPPLTRNPTFYR